MSSKSLQPPPMAPKSASDADMKRWRSQSHLRMRLLKKSTIFKKTDVVLRVNLVSKKNNLLKVMLDPILCEGFRTFMKNNFAVENFQFWFDQESLKIKLETGNEKHKLLKAMIDKYFQDGSEYQLNLDFANKLKGKIKNINFEEVFPIFDSAQQEIYSLMEMDSLPKFLRSDIFKKISQNESGLSNNQRVVQDVALTVLDNVIQFVKVFESEEKALQLEAQILIVAIRASIAAKDAKKLDKKEIAKIKGPLQKLCDKIIDGYEIPFVFSAKELVDAAAEVHKILIHILTPLLPQSDINRINELYAYFSSEKLVFDFFTKKKWKELAEVAALLRKLWDEGYIVPQNQNLSKST